VFNGSNFYMTSDAEASLLRREIWFNPDILNDRYVKRLLKYTHRGMRLRLPDLDLSYKVTFNPVDVVKQLIQGRVTVHGDTEWIIETLNMTEHSITSTGYMGSVTYTSGGRQYIKDLINGIICRLERISGLDLKELLHDREFVITMIVFVLSRACGWYGLQEGDILGSTDQEFIELCIQFIARCYDLPEIFHYDHASLLLLAASGICCNIAGTDDYGENPSSEGIQDEALDGISHGTIPSEDVHNLTPGTDDVFYSCSEDVMPLLCDSDYNQWTSYEESALFHQTDEIITEPSNLVIVRLRPTQHNTYFTVLRSYDDKYYTHYINEFILHLFTEE
jgi:hypothetical protein